MSTVHPKSRRPRFPGGRASIGATLALLMVVSACSSSDSDGAATTAPDRGPAPTVAADDGSTAEGSTAEGSAAEGSAAEGSAAGHLVDLRYEDSVIDNAAESVGTLDSAWAGSIATLSQYDARVGDDAGCYLVTVAGAFAETAACGPIRRVDTAHGDVWDLYDVTVAARQDSEGPDGPAADTPNRSSDADGNGGPVGADTPAATTVRYEIVDEPRLATESTTRPMGELWRPDGQQPGADAEGLELPDLPPAEPDTVITDAQFDLAEVIDDVTPAGTDGVIRTEGAQMEVTRFATLESYDGFAPADGQKMVLFTVETTNGPFDYQKKITGSWENGDWTATYKNGSVFHDFSDLTNGGDHTYVLSYDQTTDPVLTVSSRDFEQYLDLSTGLRQPNPQVDYWYRSENFYDLYTKVLDAYETEYDSHGYEFYQTINMVSALPYDPSAGWAEEGKKFVSIELDYDIQGGAAFRPQIGFDFSDWFIEVDGERIGPDLWPTFSQPVVFHRGGTQRFVFTVPIEATSITVHPDSTFLFGEENAVHDTQTRDMDPIEFDLPMS